MSRHPRLFVALLSLVLAAASLAPAAAQPSSPRAVVDLLDPSADDPAAVAPGATYEARIATPSAGAWALEQRPSGTAEFTPVADGTVDAAGTHTISVGAPTVDGAWDLRVRFLDPEGKRTKDTELGALDVAPPPEPAPEVAITEPGTAPAIVTAGAPTRVTFTSSRAGRYSVAYAKDGIRRDFADGAGVLLQPGSKTLAVRAPAAAGAYDLVVTVVDAKGRTGQATKTTGLIVTTPGVTLNQRCDPIDLAHCLLPFPNDHFTAADPTTPTGKRINLDVLSMPRNVAGKPIVPTEWNRNDGFSPGAMVLTQVPGIDLHRTWGETTDHIADIARYQRPDAPIVILNTRTGERHPFWSELDTHPSTTDLRRLLILRPARNFDEGTRYVVALRNMKTAAGETIASNPFFAALRDNGPLVALDPDLKARKPAMDRIFEDLAPAGVAKDDLYLAWDFTVASGENIAGRVLHMRDETLADFDSKTAVSATESGGRITGTIAVPNYLTHDYQQGGYEDYTLAAPGARMLYDAAGRPTRNPVQPTIDVPFLCQIGTGRRPMLYGHGLLGSRTEATGSSTSDMRARGFTACAIDWMGMAFSDLPNVATILADVSNFPSLADRAQQGFLNWMALGRALKNGDVPGIPGGELYYDGNSQGGIMGGALTALSPDFTRAVLGVPGMNYSTLLNRSVDWEGKDEELEMPDDPEGVVDMAPAYATFMYAAYPDKLEQQLVFALIQMIWDRAEGNGYAHHMTTNPYPNTPAHQVMLQVAFSDHQVANVAAEVEGRTIGAKLSSPALPDGLHWSVDPTFGLPPVTTDAGGSYLVYWYSASRGLTTPPNGNVPPTAGTDPHSDPRKDDRGSDQKAHFLLTGELISVCGGGPCVIP